MLCLFLLYSKVNVIHMHMPILLKIFFHISHYRMLSRVLCAIQ